MKQALFLINLLASLASSTRSPAGFHFIRLPSDLSLNESQTALFPCQSSHRARPNTWLKNGLRLDLTAARISLLNGQHLHIANVQLSDEAFYTCVATSDDGLTTKYAQARLQVTVPPSFLRLPLDAQHFEGEFAEFHCLLRGRPLPGLVWLKDGQPLANDSRHYEFYEDGQLLKVNELGRADAGLYECLVGEGGALRAAARLEVAEATRPYFKVGQQDVSVYEDQPVRLECFAGGQPRPQVLWYR